MSADEWIAQRRELLDAATQGPWDHYRPHPNYRTYQVSSVAPGGHLDDEVANCDDVLAAENAALIADARTSLPRALDALEAVLALHRRAGGVAIPVFCLHCQEFNDGTWPCATVRAIESALRADR